MARNLLKKGTRLVVFDVDKARAGELANIGAQVAKSPAEVGVNYGFGTKNSLLSHAVRSADKNISQ